MAFPRPAPSRAIVSASNRSSSKAAAGELCDDDLLADLDKQEREAIVLIARANRLLKGNLLLRLQAAGLIMPPSWGDIGLKQQITQRGSDVAKLASKSQATKA